MKARSGQRGSIIIVIISIGVILGLIGLAYYALTNQNTQTNDTIGENCKQLSLSKGESHTTAGTTFWHATITNNGDYICRLTGYPAAFMNDASTLSIGATNDSLYSPTTVVLSGNGGQAHAVIGLPPAGSAKCTNAASSTLQLFVPGISTPLTTSFNQSACPGFTITALKSGP